MTSSKSARLYPHRRDEFLFNLAPPRCWPPTHPRFQRVLAKNYRQAFSGRSAAFPQELNALLLLLILRILGTLLGLPPQLPTTSHTRLNRTQLGCRRVFRSKPIDSPETHVKQPKAHCPKIIYCPRWLPEVSSKLPASFLLSTNFPATKNPAISAAVHGLVTADMLMNWPLSPMGTITNALRAFIALESAPALVIGPSPDRDDTYDGPSRLRLFTNPVPNAHLRLAPAHFLDVLVQQLRHRRSSLPAILEDTRALFREGLRENEKKESRSSDKDSSSSRRAPDTFHPSSSSRKRPMLKPTLSTPDVGRSQVVPSPKVVDPPLHAPTPITHESRRRRTSLPNGLEAALKASSHALWLPHLTEEHSSSHGQVESSQANGHTTSHSRSSKGSHSRPSTGHSHPRTSSTRSHTSHSQTPHHHDNIQLLPHAHEQPHLRGGSASAPPPVTFLNPQQSTPMNRPLSQITTASHATIASHKSSHSRSSKSSRSSSEKITPPLPSPVPSVKPSIEPTTPKSTRSNLIVFPTVDDLFSKDETSHSIKSIRRLFGLSTPKHEPRKLSDDEAPVKKSKHSKEPSKEHNNTDSDPRQRTASFVVKPPPRETLHRARHSFDLGTFSLLDDMHMRWTTATARHFLPVLTPAEIQASHLTLSLNPALTTIHWDIRHPPNAVWSVVPGRKSVLWTGHNEPATVPLVPSLRIFSPYFPWVISARNPAGVTCGDILSAIHTSALQLVWRGEFDKLRPEDKSRLAAGYHANRPASGAPKTADAPFDAGSWLVRADWLGRHTVLRGMSVSEGKDKYGSPTPDVLLSMYLTENRREADKPALAVPRH
ncbi:unnamed protein product [Rhizoctonia solani]|uniref:DUF6699 domain-containing protein n=1 Tax=Rhizoctonia solani TaxID=456999 RepID=A0A8H3I1L7_9AGAM|nr:unnamed protein product [Rhizoctonia solani]